MAKQKVKTVALIMLLLVISAMVGVGVWRDYGKAPRLMTLKSSRAEIMSTPQFNLTIDIPPALLPKAEQILSNAEAAARTVERRMNVFAPTSELSHFNAAEANEPMTLEPATMKLLEESKKLYEQTDGAFDVTAGPVFALWKQAGKTGKLPTEAELLAARKSSHWDDIKLLPREAVKTVATANVNLGGIAKGYAIDLAAESLQASGCVGGIVDIGGDVRCFGERQGGKPWRVAVVNPFKPRSGKHFAVLAVRDSAVCTSGNYERFSTIGGKHYSHIINPKTAKPADTYPSVTVVAPTATMADAWATALSVLGPAGLEKLKGTDIQAMIVVGTPEKYEIKTTPGFAALMASP